MPGVDPWSWHFRAFAYHAGTMAPSTRRSDPNPRWAQFSDDKLLDLRLCDLRITLPGTVLEQRVERLYRELAARDLRFRPHVWLSTSWFSPDGVPGIAIPFYLAHPRLMRLEESQMFGVEGGTPEGSMQLLRHEAGHALDSAFRLHRRASWREVFGRYSEPYRQHYKPRPYSRSFVHHLEFWYAQSHPAEDYAETFSVWLAMPRKRWRAEYAGWPALKKLEYIDDLLAGLAGTDPVVKNTERVGPIEESTKTLRRYYADRQASGQVEMPDVYDHDLQRLFGRRRNGAAATLETASSFLRRHHEELRTSVAPWTGESPFIVEQVLRRVIVRVQKLRLYVTHSERRTLQDSRILLTAQTMNYIHSGSLTRQR